MRDKEFAPLLSYGFKDINETDLHKEFVSPFDYKAKDHRNNLVIGFGSFLNEFKTLGIAAEIWIDGSFATTAPDPSDVDVVFYLHYEEVKNFEGDKLRKFEKLFKSRKLIRNYMASKFIMLKLIAKQNMQNGLRFLEQVTTILPLKEYLDSFTND